MSKTDAGLIAILANYGTPEMRKVLDLKITSGYPAVTIPKDFAIKLSGSKIAAGEYQHLTIPPDLNSHLTGNNKPKIWAPKIENLIDKDGKLIPKTQKIITVVFPPISDFPVFKGKSYIGGGLLIAFSQMPHWNMNTGFVLELFAMQTENEDCSKMQHYPGDLGAYMPWQYRSLGTTYNAPYKKGDFWIQMFAITNHDPKKHKSVAVNFW